MYIIEIIAKKLFQNRKKNNISYEEPDYTETEDNTEDCEHVYIAIDSTQDYFACNKCGNVIKNKKKEVKTENIFKI